MLAAIDERRFAEKITPFDEPAYDSGVFYVPTYFIGGEVYAEQTYLAIESAVRRELGLDGSGGVYPFLLFGEPKDDRPYTYINMVSTIDGKTVSGGRDETVMDLGSDLDHATMRQIEEASDAVMIGAGNLRATRKIRFSKRLTRIVVTGSGRVPDRKQFFGEGKAIVATTERGAQYAPKETETIVCGENELDLKELMKKLRKEHGIERLLVEGGSELNASLLKQDLVDELFLTVAPKVKLGREVPTYAGGEPLPREAMLKFRLLTARPVGDEIFVRYKRDR